jgi:hypothetical protein
VDFDHNSDHHSGAVSGKADLMSVPILIQHTRDCPRPGMGHSDAAKRMCDTYNLHRAVDLYGNMGKWFAVRLADGTGDGMLYDTKSEAALFQRIDEKYFAYVQVTAAQMTICSAEAYLMLLRRMYDAGIRQVDPDDAKGGKEVIKRMNSEDQLAQVFGRPQNLLDREQ